MGDGVLIISARRIARRKEHKMRDWQSGYIESNAIRMHYTRTGGAKPPLVLAHGVTDDGLCWTPVAEALEAEYDVIMVDARGHGRSDAPEQGYGPAEQAKDLAGLIRGLDLRRPVILGHSMGAATTLTLAGTYPDMPGAIVLEDPPGWWMASPEREEASEDDEAETGLGAKIHGRDPASEDRRTGMQAWFAGLKRKTREELIAEQRAATPGWSEEELGPWADSKLSVSSHVLNVFSARPEATVDWPATLRRITCPALLITADTDRGAVLREDAAAALQALVPHLRIAHVPGAGHNVRRDQFDHFLTVVQAFLREPSAERQHGS
jgi:pimeloyl-ACP methyl ester carboxylesterase